MNNDYNNGFFDGARWAFGILRDDEDGRSIASFGASSIEWDIPYSDTPDEDRGYVDGIRAVISHLPIKEGTFSADTDYTPCINLGELLAGAI